MCACGATWGHMGQWATWAHMGQYGAFRVMPGHLEPCGGNMVQHVFSCEILGLYIYTYICIRIYRFYVYVCIYIYTNINAYSKYCNTVGTNPWRAAAVGCQGCWRRRLPSARSRPQPLRVRPLRVVRGDGLRVHWEEARPLNRHSWILREIDVEVGICTTSSPPCEEGHFGWCRRMEVACRLGIINFGVLCGVRSH